jgi:ParB family chromosome partitioning protein
LARQHGIRKDRETDAIGKLFGAFVRRAVEGTLSRLLVEATVLLAAARTNPAVVLREAAATYKELQRSSTSTRLRLQRYGVNYCLSSRTRMF